MPRKGRQSRWPEPSRATGKAGATRVRIVGRGAKSARSRQRSRQESPRAQSASSARQWRAEGPALLGLAVWNRCLLCRMRREAAARKVSPISLHSLCEASTKMSRRRFAWASLLSSETPRRGSSRRISSAIRRRKARRRSATGASAPAHPTSPRRAAVIVRADRRRSVRAQVTAGRINARPSPEETRGLSNTGCIRRSPLGSNGSSAPA